MTTIFSGMVVEDKRGNAEGPVPALESTSGRADPPNGISGVVGHEDTSAAVDRYIRGTTVGIPIVIQEARQQHRRLAGWLSVGERNEHHAIAAARNAIPRAVLRDDHPAVESIRQVRMLRIGDSHRRRVRTESVVGCNRLPHHLGILLDPRIRILPMVAVWPSIERALLHRGEIVRWKIG